MYLFHLVGLRKQLETRVVQGEGFKLIHARYSVLRLQLEAGECKAINHRDIPLFYITYVLINTSHLQNFLSPNSQGHPLKL